MGQEHLVSVCIPTLGRAAALARCVEAVTDNTRDWPYELIVEHDSFEQRAGCPRTLAKAVARSTGAFVAFLGNDCLPRPGWLRIAMECLLRTWPDGVGAAGFGDSHWPDRALHFVAAKALLPLLDGYFLNPCYSHAGCDDELQARLRMAGKFILCPEAKVDHDHFISGAEFDPVYQLAWKAEAVERDRALLRERAERMGFTEWLPK